MKTTDTALLGHTGTKYVAFSSVEPSELELFHVHFVSTHWVHFFLCSSLILGLLNSICISKQALFVFCLFVFCNLNLIGRLSFHLGHQISFAVSLSLVSHFTSRYLEASSLSDLWTSSTGVIIQGRVLGMFVGNSMATNPKMGGEWLQVREPK